MPAPRLTRLLFALVVPFSLVAPSEAAAQCGSANSLWTGDLGTGTPSAPASDTGFIGGSSFSYIANGNKLWKWDNTKMGPGQKEVWKASLPGGATIQNFPSPVPLSNMNGETIFIGATDGFLYRINANDGVTLWSRDMRRPSCPLGDKIIATPTVQLWDYVPNTVEGNAWKAAMTAAGFAGRDLVIVVTRYGCGTTTANQVIAVPASTGNVDTFWTSDPSEMMDYGSEGCSIDYDTNTAFCGTNGALHIQPSLYAIDTKDGSTKWSQDAGPIRNRPELRGANLYVASYDGALSAFDPTSGALFWTQTVTAGANVVRNPWPEFRSGGYAGTILIIDNSGVLHGFVDLGGYGELAWPAPAFPAAVTTMPAIDPVTGKGWIGLSNGKLSQFDLGTGLSESTGTVATGSVFDPSLDINSTSSTEVDRLTVAAFDAGRGAYQIRRYCIPWGSGWTGTTSEPPNGTPAPPQGMCDTIADCPANPMGVCYVWACSAKMGKPGVCYRDPKPKENKPCTVDPFNCGITKTCHSGICTVPSGEVKNCQCMVDGDRACDVAAGEVCTGRDGCKKLLSDPLNCGSPGNRCAVGEKCDGGRCIRNIPSYCQNQGGTHRVADASVLNPIAGNGGLLGASGISYDCFNGGAGCTAGCSVNLSTFRTCMGMPCTANAGVTAITPAGGITVYNAAKVGNNASFLFHGVDSDGAANLLGNMTGGTSIDNPNPYYAAPPGMLGVVGLVNPPAVTTDPGMPKQPFSNAFFDWGPVGPSVNDQAVSKINQTITVGPFYFGNWATNGDVYYLVRTMQGGWSAGSVKNALGAPWNAGSRVRAVAYGVRKNAGNVKNSNIHTLYVATKTGVYFCDVGTPYNAGMPGSGWDSCAHPTDFAPSNTYGFVAFNSGSVDSDGFRPNVAAGESSVNDVYSATTDPHYGDLIVEVRDGTLKTEMLMVREDDHSIRNLADVGRVLQWVAATATPVYPLNPPLATYTGQGRLSARSASLILRMVPAGANSAAAFSDFGVAP